MGERTDLQTILEGVLGSDNVYYQPPPTLMIEYPCIVYDRTKIDTRFADNLPYNNGKYYTVTIIGHGADSPIPDALLLLPSCVFDRHFIADNLNHDVFTIFF